MPMPWWWPFGRVPEIAPEQLAQRVDAGEVQLLDVRTRVEWKASHIEGAINVPIGELRARLSTLGLDPGRPVVAICLSAHRSVPAVRLLERAGFGEAQQLAGGMTAWWVHQLPTVSGDDSGPA